MEPLLPSAHEALLAELTCEILRQSGSLSAQLPSPVVRDRVTRLVQQMNSYYSNLIEGHRTLPRDIEKALRQDFSQDPSQRANQHLNKAHIEVERLMLERLRQEPNLSIHASEFICWLHREFYQRLPEELHWASDVQGKKYRIEPGALRSFEVEVGRHQPPYSESLPLFLDRFQQAYSAPEVMATRQLVAMAAAHHRLAWIHPFGDGNGRVIRLHSHAWLVRARMDSLGLWTLSRGLARSRQKYFTLLASADQPRWNDLDGRGNLTDRGLGDFCVFLLETILDQLSFMSGLLQLPVLAKRIDSYLQTVRVDFPVRTRERVSRLLRAALMEGELERGRAGEVMGMSASGARVLVRQAVDEGLLDSPSEKGPLSLVFSAETLESYFPNLYSLS